MGARMGDRSLFERWSAGFGDVVTRVRVNGPRSFRFEVTAGARTWVFRSCAEVAMAIYQSGERVTWDRSWNVSSEQVAALVVAGADRGEYAAAAAVWQDCEDPAQFEICHDLAGRLIALTDSPWSYPRYPQWHPAWRVNELENVSQPGRELEGVPA